ncbi:UDP-glucose 4-epimerase-like [Babylonia areolata]|uniref:UDP-glucose 4-epimerase-like n=1 Tax=Babylonia areolata TaxID=304850 RepID=UPI003FD1B4FC
MHMASLKAVGESCKRPFFCYKANLFSAINLIEVMADNNVYNLIFSSSATVYGPPKVLPLVETLETGGCTSPYGRTKFFIENIFRDVCTVDPKWNMIFLRYFNPVGAHESGIVGEEPMGVPYNIMPFVAQVAVGRRKEVEVFGNDFDTPDGTGVRDYVHVVDLAKGHLAAMKKIDENSGEQPKIYNLGTGKGISVLEIINAFEKHTGQKIPYKIVGRREGDVDTMIADASKAGRELGWKTERGLKEMCLALWNFQSKNPYGYQGKPDNE